MVKARPPLPGQKTLFQETDPAAALIPALRCWPDDALLRVVREASYELLRRNRAVPVAAPVAEAMAAIAVAAPVG